MPLLDFNLVVYVRMRKADKTPIPKNGTDKARKIPARHLELPLEKKIVYNYVSIVQNIHIR